MDEEGKYWKIKWEDAQREIQSLKQILKDEFEWLDSREVNKMIREEKKVCRTKTKAKRGASTTFNSR